MSKKDDCDALLAEFSALRDETLSTINGRIWGMVTYIALAGGAIVLYDKTKSTTVFVLLVFAALPFLWHTATRERSRLRIGSYIKVILEPRSALNWESYLAEWRSVFSAPTNFLDRWRHIFSLTGIYTLITILAMVCLFRESAPTLERIIAIAGVILNIEGHLYFNRSYSQARHYDNTFLKINQRLEKKTADDL